MPAHDSSPPLTLNGAESFCYDVVTPTGDVWVDKPGFEPTYLVGGPITICYSVNQPIYIELFVAFGGAGSLIVEGFDDGTGDCFSGTIEPPQGQSASSLTPSIPSSRPQF
ncbi:MAG: hypothetical protein ACE5IZ_01235 [Dehalococcoidia bacterium]